MQQFFIDLLRWFSDEIKAIFLWFYDAWLSGLAFALESMPVPDFLLVQQFTMPPGVSYFASAFQLDVGLGVIVSAYTARFILRRIPIIG